jgi:hypothetical protein
MSRQLFKEFTEKAETIFKTAYTSTFIKYMDSVNDLTDSLGDIKRNTAHQKNDGSIKENIKICELILELLKYTIEMRSVLKRKDQNAKLKIELVILLRESAINVEEKLKDVVLFDNVIRHGVWLIITYVDVIKDIYNKFTKQILEFLDEISEKKLEKENKKQAEDNSHKYKYLSEKNITNAIENSLKNLKKNNTKNNTKKNNKKNNNTRKSYEPQKVRR